MQILHNAKIFTGGIHPNFSEAIAIDGNKIIAIGSNDDILSIANRDTSIRNLHGKTILPGLTDSHIHLQHTARSLSMVNCETDNIEELIKRVSKSVRETKPGKWVFGHGWNQNLWQNGFDELQSLHQISTEHPILLTAKSLHACWANKCALELAGINTQAIDPSGGVIGRNADKSPNGLFFENAMEMVFKVVPPPTKSELMQSLILTQEELWKFGITSVHDFDGVDCFQALQKLDQEHSLKIRVVKSIPFSIFEEIIKTGIQTGFGSDFLKIGSVKLFSDGALGPQTAAMLSPYENDASNVGILLLNKDQIIEIGQKATNNGLSLAIHAIGDKANREVIDAYCEIRTYEEFNNLPLQNHRIEHVQILHENDLGRLVRNKITASMQPIHLISDMHTADLLWGSRSRYAYAFNTLLQHGTNPIFGSDAPVESFNPFIGIYAALTRQILDQTPDQGWYPQEKIDLISTINAYTINPAMVAKSDDQIGSLEKGKLADLIVLPTDIFNMPSQEIKDILPVASMVGGGWVYQREEI